MGLINFFSNKFWFNSFSIFSWSNTFKSVSLKPNNFTFFEKIIDLLNPLITDYLQKESIQLLLQKDKIIFGDDKLDITKEILKIFNEKHSKISFE